MNQLDREGIFKGLVLSWGIKKEKDSQSVAIVVEYQITAQLDGAEWTDWSEYEPHGIKSYSYIIKRDGTLHEGAVKQLCDALGWNRDLTTFTKEPPAGIIAQLNVRWEEYNGRKSLKVGWINPEDYSPEPRTASPDDVKKLQNRYGSLLRAAAGGATKKAAPPPTKQMAVAEKFDATPEEKLPWENQY